MSLFTALRLWVVDWLTGWLPDPYQPAAFAEQDDDVHELTDEESARLAPFDCYPDCGCMPTVEPVPTADDGTDYIQALTDLTAVRRMWADLDEYAYLADAERCHHCPPSVCNGIPERKTLTDTDRADIALDAAHKRREDGLGDPE